MTPISNLQLPTIAQISFSAGRLANFCKHWLTIPSVTRTLKSITSGYKLPFTSIPPHTVCENKSFSSEKMIQLEDSITDLLRSGAVQPCQPVPGQFISSIFLVPKPNGSMRFMLNLKKLNVFLTIKSNLKI